jgi:hypothetical protein
MRAGAIDDARGPWFNAATGWQVRAIHLKDVATVNATFESDPPA